MYSLSDLCIVAPQLRISLDVASDVDKRWSDVVPPNSALTFAALWDPNDGMVTFSGAHLLDLPNECESSSGVTTFPDIFDDDVSEAVSHEHTSDSEESAATTVASQDAPKAFLHRVPRNSKFHKQHPNTLASPALDRLDVYPRDPHVSLKHQSSVHRSVMVDEKSSSKTQAVVRNLSPESDDVSDEGFFEDISAVKGRTELVRLTFYHEALFRHDISLRVIEITLVRYNHIYVSLCRVPIHVKENVRTSESYTTSTVDRR